jgi:alkanesulfonate monooxygenase SsuD/methylene tetrahydromethanopterin reductase-like flavin-dependent oxidoreductase (luciferase family)
MAGPTYGKNPPADVLDFGLWIEQEYQTWESILDVGLLAENAGLDSVWLFDHFMPLSDKEEQGLCLEGWTSLAALAMATKNVQLGHLVVGMTHRHPAVMFKEATTVDHISGGRLILGVGAGWYERGHEAYGIPFPSPGERVDRFGEALEVFRLLETQERTTYHGKHIQIVNTPFEPKPVNGHIPILVGSTGNRMLRHIAKYADQWDGGGTPEEYRVNGERLKEACAEVGRDPGEIRWTTSVDQSIYQDPAALKRHVEAMAAVGVRSFRLLVPREGVTDIVRRAATDYAPALRGSVAVA